MYDHDIRAALVAQLEGAGVRVVHEWSVGGCVLDVAAITDRLHAYEIKGPRDSLARLEGQVEAYSAAFDRCTLVAAGHLITRATNAGLVPEWWGIARACSDDNGRTVVFERQREARQNPTQKPRSLAWLCYSRELRAILQRRCLPYRYPPNGYMGKPKMATTAADHIPVDELRAEVIRALLARPYWKDPATGGRRTTGADTVQRLEIDGRAIGPIAR